MCCLVQFYVHYSGEPYKDLIEAIGILIFKLQKLSSVHKACKHMGMLTTCYSEFKIKMN